jgi:hypothetical protein
VKKQRLLCKATAYLLFFTFLTVARFMSVSSDGCSATQGKETPVCSLEGGNGVLRFGADAVCAYDFQLVRRL